MARGNAVMRAKRTTGPTPNAQLLQRVKCETCSKCGSEKVLRSLTRQNGSIVRVCGDCIAQHDNGAKIYQNPREWRWTR